MVSTSWGAAAVSAGQPAICWRASGFALPLVDVRVPTDLTAVGQGQGVFGGLGAHGMNHGAVISISVFRSRSRFQRAQTRSLLSLNTWPSFCSTVRPAAARQRHADHFSPWLDKARAQPPIPTGTIPQVKYLSSKRNYFPKG